MRPAHNFISRKDEAASAADTDGGERRRFYGSNFRVHFIAALGEFIGTFMFLFFGYAGHFMVARSSTGSETDTTSGDSAQTTIFVALAYGFSLLITVWTMYRISGGLFNPALMWFPEGVYYTGGSLNPVRSFGCAVAGAEFPRYHWIYWVGPFLGSLLGTGLYKIFKILHYEDANPGQDAAHPDEITQLEESRDLESAVASQTR
ncbi:hypothetical protein PpBr36_02004 [Pyricularia pennisetigena]|uniref:hypothetical protein n=1 Tax=Pyricularia pennisetigena TaxID=1578925 RepID=UPI001151A0DF|nr:hypothetical protein PpBr36_02004 [Pyricularia pennisetigena]TLS27949.1 hypothetical protein PpBr36_02004 [Pyricularia pennisetigena]